MIEQPTPLRADTESVNRMLADCERWLANDARLRAWYETPEGQAYLRTKEGE